MSPVLIIGPIPTINKLFLVHAREWDFMWYLRVDLVNLEDITQPDISYAVHQCAWFSEDKRKPYGEAVKRIGGYLKGTNKMFIYIRPCDSKAKVWAEADLKVN